MLLPPATDLRTVSPSSFLGNYRLKHHTYSYGNMLAFVHKARRLGTRKHTMTEECTKLNYIAELIKLPDPSRRTLLEEWSLQDTLGDEDDFSLPSQTLLFFYTHTLSKDLHLVHTLLT